MCLDTETIVMILLVYVGLPLLIITGIIFAIAKFINKNYLK